MAISSTKSITGHMLGAAEGAEALFSLLAIRGQVVPPTINDEIPDADCDLDDVPNDARELAVDVVLSTSFGFGGTNGTLIFSACDPRDRSGAPKRASSRTLSPLQAGK